MPRIRHFRQSSQKSGRFDGRLCNDAYSGRVDILSRGISLVGGDDWPKRVTQTECCVDIGEQEEIINDKEPYLHNKAPLVCYYECHQKPIMAKKITLEVWGLIREQSMEQ